MAGEWCLWEPRVVCPAPIPSVERLGDEVGKGPASIQRELGSCCLETLCSPLLSPVWTVQLLLSISELPGTLPDKPAFALPPRMLMKTGAQAVSDSALWS